ncbi:hypothetical protein PSHT_07036 [Puccinia striiformis]|uniref:Uncharacterized protein n=1 Tax=Puccinia striiformis TaxID=27350 RepID=A0A2S4W2B5_9BASI|nr:hypothetical protein PSHT_07036 [Puccinia striiformis]
MYGNTAVTPQPKTKAHQELDDMFNWTFLSLVLVAYLHIIAGLSIKEANTTLLTIKMILEGFKTCGYVNLSILKRVESATLYCLVPMVVHFVNTPPKTSTNGFRVSLTKKEQKAYWQPLQITSVKMLNLALAVISGMAQCGTIFLTPAGRRSILGFLRRNGQRRMTEDEEHHQRIPIGLPSDAYAQDYINQLSMREHRELQISTEKHALTLHEALDQLNQLTMIS